MTLTIGMICFGSLIGFITYRTLVRTTDKTSIHDLAVVIGAVGGGAVTTLVRPMTDAFAWYAIGLLAGFVAYALLYLKMNGKDKFALVMGGHSDTAEPTRGPGAPGHQ
jgi:bacteriorhodopsin